MPDDIERLATRRGPGRPKGSPNKKRVARELAANRAIDETLARLTQEEIERFTPLEIMTLGMHLLLRAGNLMGAIATAEKVAPFVHAKLSANIPPQVLPIDLLPDPEPVGDEIGPDRPIL